MAGDFLVKKYNTKVAGLFVKSQYWGSGNKESGIWNWVQKLQKGIKTG